MTTDIDLAELARAISEIASGTTDPETGKRLLQLAEGLLAAEGIDTPITPD